MSFKDLIQELTEENARLKGELAQANIVRAQDCVQFWIEANRQIHEQTMRADKAEEKIAALEAQLSELQRREVK